MATKFSSQLLKSRLTKFSRPGSQESVDSAKLKSAGLTSYFPSLKKPVLTLKDIVDPVCDHFYNDVWRATAANNTKIYDEVFQCYPSDRAKTFSDVARLRNIDSLSSINPSLAKTKLEGIQGNLVEFPLEFLLKEPYLKPGFSSKEGLLPSETWTWIILS